MTRGFKIAKGYEHKGIKLPQRSTQFSAGYDLASAETVTLPSVWSTGAYQVAHQIEEYHKLFGNKIIGQTLSVKQWEHYQQIRQNMMRDIDDYFKPTMVHTGIKAYCKPNEFIAVYNRSSNPVKRGLWLSNGVGVVDQDYYGNPSNDGELMVALLNFHASDYTIHKGDRIAQAVFQPYLLADNDHSVHLKRQGGWGSSGK